MDFVPESLKDECLNVILENFERFYGAFKLSQGSVLGKHFEYLERAFSETLFHKLLMACKLEEKYFEFLINPHVRRLNLEGINEDLMPALVKQLNMIESNIVLLKTAFWNVELDHYKQLICSVPDAEIIEISIFVYPEVLAEIGKRCHALRILKILNCEVDDIGLMNIFLNVNGEYENKASLEQLDVTSTNISDLGVSFALSHAPSLKCLDYSGTPKVLYEKHKGDLGNNCIEDLKKYSLTSLAFPSWEKNVLDTLKICTTLCPYIASLNIHCLENDEQLLLCSKFRHLRDLKIRVEANYLSFNGFTQFFKLRGRDLLSVHLESGCASAEAIVEHCPKLCSLKLFAVKYEPFDSKNNYLFLKGTLANLKVLAVTNSDFSVKETADSVKLILSNAKNVNSINFSGCEGLQENFVRSVSQLRLFQVHELNLNSSDVTVSPVTDLLLHGNLQKLSVANCSNITETEYFHLLTCRGDSDVLITTNIFGSDGESSDSDDDDESVDYDYEDCDDLLAYGSERDSDYDCNYFSDYDQYDLCDCDSYDVNGFLHVYD